MAKFFEMMGDIKRILKEEPSDFHETKILIVLEEYTKWFYHEGFRRGKLYAKKDMLNIVDRHIDEWSGGLYRKRNVIKALNDVRKDLEEACSGQLGGDIFG